MSETIVNWLENANGARCRSISWDIYHKRLDKGYVRRDATGFTFESVYNPHPARKRWPKVEQ